MRRRDPRLTATSTCLSDDGAFGGMSPGKREMSFGDETAGLDIDELSAADKLALELLVRQLFHVAQANHLHVRGGAAHERLRQGLEFGMLRGATFGGDEQQRRLHHLRQVLRAGHDVCDSLAEQGVPVEHLVKNLFHQRKRRFTDRQAEADVHGQQVDEGKWQEKVGRLDRSGKQIRQEQYRKGRRGRLGWCCLMLS